MEIGMVVRCIVLWLKMMMFEYWGRLKVGWVGIMLWFFVDKEGFDVLGEVLFKQLYIGINGLLEELVQDVRVYWIMYGFDEGMLETLFFSKFQLFVYYVIWFVDSYRGKLCFFVGDVVMGVFYFRVFNLGWVMGLRLVYLIGMGVGLEKIV